MIEPANYLLKASETALAGNSLTRKSLILCPTS